VVGAQERAFRQEGPIAIEKCQTIDKPGSYKLVNNLTAPSNTDCLVINASFVTIDLDGFSISSGGGTAGEGVNGSVLSPHQLHGIAVRNGSIANFSVGVNLSAPDFSIVEGLRVSGGGIIAVGIVRGNVVRNAATGILGGGIVTGNYAVANGVGLDIDPGSTVIGNLADDNTSFGIRVSCPSNVTDNTAANNPQGNLVLNGNGCNNTNNVAP
jgi:hypothetical protein